MAFAKGSELAENKLILLYFLNKLNMPISSLQVIKIILENKFMNYFLLQQNLQELCENGLLECGLVDGKTFYSLTSRGKQILSYFCGYIPVGIKARIDNTVSELRKNIRNETMIKADYTVESEDKYTVSCKVLEDDFPLISLEITVGTKNDARTICNNWEKHSEQIYSEIISSLIKSRD